MIEVKLFISYNSERPVSEVKLYTHACKEGPLEMIKLEFPKFKSKDSYMPRGAMALSYKFLRVSTLPIMFLHFRITFVFLFTHVLIPLTFEVQVH